MLFRSRECMKLEDELNELEASITRLQVQYQADATSRKAYQKATYDKLSRAYDKRESLSYELQQKQAEYNAVMERPESSTSHSSYISGTSSSSGLDRRSSKSSAPAIIGWDCGACGRANFTDPWEDNNTCTCRHRFCEDDNHCTVQWNP